MVLRASREFIDRQEHAFFIRQLMVVFLPVLALLTDVQVQSWKLLILFAVLAGVFNLGYYFLNLRGYFTPRLKWIQITIDLAAWTGLIALTGGTRSFFFLGYPFEILVCAITLSTRGCVYAGAVSALLYTTVALATGFALPDLVPKLLFLGAVTFLSTVLIRKYLKINECVTALNEKLHDKVEASNEELKNIVASLSTGLIAIDAGQNVIEFNNAAEEITGLRKEDVISRPISEVFPGPKGIGSVLLESHRLGTKESPLTTLRVADQVKTLAICPFTIASKSDTKVGALIQDVTEVEEMRERMIRARALSALGTMVASIAHDLRNPLNGMKGFLSLLKLDLAQNRRPDPDIMRRLESGVTSLEKTLENLLLYSRTPKMSKQILDLRKLTAGAIKYLPQEDSKLQVTSNIGQMPVYVEADPELLTRCILNLLINAKEAMPFGGTISVSLRCSNDHAELSITDSGPGIPDHMKDRIFAPFVSTKGSGSGLGLAIVHNLVELHNGRIGFLNHPGSGARFTITLPVATHTLPATGPLIDMRVEQRNDIKVGGSP